MRLTLIAAAVIAATAGSVQAETYSLSNGEDSVETNSSFSTENGEVFAVSVTGTGNASFTGTSFAASSNYTLGDKWNAAVYVSGDEARTKPLSSVIQILRTSTLPLRVRIPSVFGLGRAASLLLKVRILLFTSPQILLRIQRVQHTVFSPKITVHRKTRMTSGRIKQQSSSMPKTPMLRLTILVR